MTEQEESLALELYASLKTLFEDEDADIDGGDLVEAIACCVHGRFAEGLMLIDEMIEAQCDD